MFGIDCTSTRNHAELKKVGVRFCCRYLSHTPSKNLTVAEAKALRANGIAIVTVFESTGQTAKGGRAAGIDDARISQSQLQALGASREPVYFALDYAPPPSDYPRIAQYFDGVNSVIGWERSGAYGDDAVLKMLFDAGKIRFGWQTYAWSGGRWEKRAQLQQYLNGQTLAGNSVDYDRAMTRNFGQWNPPLIPIPKPKPTYDVTVLNALNVPVRMWSTRYPGLSLVRYNVALRKPHEINVVHR